MKVIFSKFQKPFPLHFPQLCRQRRPVHAQIVGELLAVEWDIKSLALIFYRLIGEVRQKPSPDGFRRCIEDPAGQLQVFLRRDCKQVADKLRVMSSRIGTLRQHYLWQTNQFCPVSGCFPDLFLCFVKIIRNMEQIAVHLEHGDLVR